MGGRANRIRENVLDMLSSKSERYADILKIRDFIKENLVSSLDNNSFADMYAQTLVYGLFSARYNDKSFDSFSRTEARELVPKTNPFLSSFFDHIAGNTFPERLRFIVDELCEVFTHANVHKLMHEYFKKENLFGEVYESPDPVIHFYEDFLKEYDSKKKMEMGVFYTPRPVVGFIVRAVDDIIKNEFGIVKGLADNSKIQLEKTGRDAKGKEIKEKREYHKVQILDIATGTGRFLNEVILNIHGSFIGQEGRWPAYVESDLLPRLHGFELMMASYTIAHLKLGMTLEDLKSGELKKRIGIYLTNTLEEAASYEIQPSMFGVMESIVEERKSASRIKSEYPIMCVIGNPPYSGISQNKIYTDNSVYKVEIGGKEKLKEKKNWLDDDYVKFIRYAESLIEKNKEGIIGMITAHGYIDNPTFRGMRWHLRNTFDKIYIIDLHGNSNKKEISQDGSKDENIFDIKTGVSIILGVKRLEVKGKKLAQIYKTDFYGLRKEKFKKLDLTNFYDINWLELPENSDRWVSEGVGKLEYLKGFSVVEIFPKNTTGIVTMGDSFIIDQDKHLLKERVQNFLFNDITEDNLKAKYNLGKNYAKWVVDNKRKIEDDVTKIVPLAYRPFDIKYTYFDKNLVWRTRGNIMENLTKKGNIGLIFARSQRNPDFNAIFMCNSIMETKCGEASTQSAVAPIYLYSGQGEKIPNLNKEIWSNINKVVGETTPENILDYIYAVLHSPKYRETYKEFLKIDFPRVPYPTDKKEFGRLIKFGEKLRGLHLMTDPECNKLITKYAISGGSIVEKVKYENNNVYINSIQHFEGVPEVAWKFYIGGYQPAQKYLKDRKGRQLTSDEIEHYQKIIKVLFETDKIMKEIDR